MLQSSFGFGQVGGTCLIVHPRYLFGALNPSEYESYKLRNRLRYRLSYKAMSDMMIRNSLVKVKDHPPYTPELERSVLLNSQARTSYDPKTGGYAFTSKMPKSGVYDTANAKAVTEILATESTAGVGVDQELISAVPSWNETFVNRNFTDAEIEYCRSQPSPDASFAARWVGKEAVFKALGVASKGAAAAMKDIEILPDASGVPTVALHGDAQTAAASKQIVKVHVSLSHSDVSLICPYSLQRGADLYTLDHRYCLRSGVFRIDELFSRIRSWMIMSWVSDDCILRSRCHAAYDNTVSASIFCNVPYIIHAIDFSLNHSCVRPARLVRCGRLRCMGSIQSLLVYILRNRVRDHAPPHCICLP